MNAPEAVGTVPASNGLAPGRPLRQSRDVRGVVFEPLDAAALAAQRNVHVVLSVPGAVRGNHFHRVQHEVTVVVGPARVAWRMANPGDATNPGDAAKAGDAGDAGDAGNVATAPGTTIETIDVPAGAAWRFEFPPGVAHAFENTGRETQVLVAFATQSHDPANPDTFRDTLLGDVAGPTPCEDDL